MRIRYKKTSAKESEALEKRQLEMDELRKNVTPAQKIQASRVMGAIGAALVACFFLTIAYSNYENGKTIAVKGTVISTGSKTSENGAGTNSTTYTSYSHTFSYTDLDGVERTGSDNGERQSAFRSGAVVSIGYYPDDFSQIRIHSWFGLWKVQLVLLGLGSVLIWYMFKSIALIRAEEEAKSNAPDDLA